MKLKLETISKYNSLAYADLHHYMTMTDDEFARQHVSISESNVKTGDTPSISLLPINTCGNCNGCRAYCYAVRMALRFPAVRKAWARNTAIYRRDPNRYWSEIREYIKKKNPSAFRFHVAGEIENMLYLHEMNITADMFPAVRFWTYTKNHDTVNGYIETCNAGFFSGISRNLSIMFSMGMNCREDNPHNMPEFIFVPHGYSGPLFYYFHECAGGCKKCLDERRGCPYGETSVVKEH